jgi:chromosomal replication initiation ATPase DnaA
MNNTMIEPTEKLQPLEQLIIAATSFHYGIEPDFLKMRKNTDRNSTFQRFICFYMIKQKTSLSNLAIGCIFDLKEPSIWHGLKRIESFKDIKDKRTITDIRNIELIIDNFSRRKIDNLNNY